MSFQLLIKAGVAKGTPWRARRLQIFIPPQNSTYWLALFQVEGKNSSPAGLEEKPAHWWLSMAHGWVRLINRTKKRYSWESVLFFVKLLENPQ